MQRIRERNQLLALVIGLVLVMAACGGDAVEPAATSAPASTATTLIAAPTTTVAASPTTTAETAVVESMSIGTVTITDSGCVQNVDDQASTGQITFTAVNESGGRAAAEVFVVLEGHTYEDLVAHVDMEIELADAGEEGLGHPRPPVATFASRGSGLLDSGESMEVTIDAKEPGIYGVFCMRQHPNTSDPVRPFAIVGPLEVSQPPTVTLSASGCRYEGPVEMAVGQLRIGMTNETTGQFDIDLWLPHNGHGYDELAAHIDEERKRNEAGEPPLGHPPFATLVAEASAEAGSTSELVTDIAVGTYGMACIYFDQPGSLGGIWAAGPITVLE